MANTYYDSELTAEEIEEVLEAISGILTPANNGKVLAISNGKIEARSVQWGGGSTLEPLSVTANGDYYPEAGVDGFDEVHVSVPNSYTASDEGKVVSNGALVAQTARVSQITQNGTYDTTLNDEVTVNVSGGGGGGGGSSFPTLPNAYQRVEYISCTGEQYATVQNFSLPTDKFIRIVMESAVSGEKCMFGFTGSGGTQFECFTGSNAIADDYGQSLILYWTEYASSYTLVNKKQFAIWKVNNLCEKAFIAMYRNSTGSNSYKYNGKIFRITISDSDNLEWYSVGTATFDFIPCYRKSDSVPGFYDVINDVFYPSESGVPFVAGPDAN